MRAWTLPAVVVLAAAMGLVQDGRLSFTLTDLAAEASLADRHSVTATSSPTAAASASPP